MLSAHMKKRNCSIASSNLFSCVHCKSLFSNARELSKHTCCRQIRMLDETNAPSRYPKRRRVTRTPFDPSNPIYPPIDEHVAKAKQVLDDDPIHDVDDESENTFEENFRLLMGLKNSLPSAPLPATAGPTDGESEICTTQVITDVTDAAVAAVDDENLVISDEDNYTLLQQFEKHIRTGKSNMVHDSLHNTEVELLEMMRSSGMPLKYYDKIMDWAWKANTRHSFDPRDPPKRRKTVLKDLMKAHDLEGFAPTVISFKLPRAGVKVNLTRHSIQQAIYSLLTCPILNRDENYIWNDNPLEPPPDSNVISDLHHGSAYRAAYKTHVKVPNLDAVNGLIMFSDKAHTAQGGRLNVEPIQITLGIFNLDTRLKSHAWRTIGYIPNMDRVPTKKLSSDEKMHDYHAMIDVILRPLAEFQKKDYVGDKPLGVFSIMFDTGSP